MELSEDSRKILVEVAIISQKFNDGRTLGEMQNEHREFMDKHPAIFNLCSKKGMNMSELENMLKMRDNIAAKKIKKSDAEMKYGQHMFKKYLRDKFSEEDIHKMVDTIVSELSPFMNDLRKSQKERKEDPQKLMESLGQKHALICEKYLGIPDYFLEKNITDSGQARDYLIDFYLN
jgi:hypothetical protein